MTPSLSTERYQGQYLKEIKRRNKAGEITQVAYYFKPRLDLCPETWTRKYKPAIRLPRDPAARTGMGRERDPQEYARAWADASQLYAELNRLRGAPADGGSWPHGSLRWLCMDWRKSTWFRDELAPDTRNGYESCLRAIEEWADEVAAKHNGVHHHVRQMSIQGITKFLSRYNDRTTRRSALKVVLHNLFTHAISEGVVDTNPVKEVRLARRKRGHTRKRAVVLWDQGFVNSFVAAAKERGRPEVAAWAALSWDIGQRPRDIHQMLVMNDLERMAMIKGKLAPGNLYFDPADDVVRGWQSKTKSWVSIPLDSSTLALIRAVLPAPGSNYRHVFINPVTGEPYEDSQFNKQFQRTTALFSEEHTTPQMGRHSCIVRLKRAKLSDSDIMTITGHSDPRTIYRHYWTGDDEQAAEAKRLRTEHEGKAQ